MADLVTRLLLNNTQFDNNIKESTKQVQAFLEAGKAVTNTVTKFAGAVGLAMGTMETLEKYINSTRLSQLEFLSSLEGARSTVTDFFSSISTGDWSVFESGISNAIRLSKNYKKALIEALQANKLSKGEAEYYEGLFNVQEAIIKDESSTPEEKAEAYRKAQEYTKLREEALNKAITANDNSFKALKTKYNLSYESPQEMREAYWDYGNAGTQQYKLLEAFEKERNDLLAIKRGLELQSVNNQYGIIDVGTLAQIQAIDEKLNKMNNSTLGQASRLVNAIHNDEENILELLEASGEMYDKIGTAQKDMQGVADDYKKTLEDTNKTTKKLGNISKKEIAPKESVKWYEEQITTIKKQISLEVNPQKQAELYKELNRLEQKKLNIEIVYKYDLTEQPKALNTASKSLQQWQDKEQKRFLEWNKTVQVNAKGIKVTPTMSTSTKEIDNTTDSLTAMALVLGNITAMTNDSGAAWLTWSANLLTAVASALPAISTLIKAKTAEAGTNAVASATQTPVVGWLLAGAAVTSVLAALAALPSFSTGGIFEGNKTIGDYNLARVNAGEMILNNRQQRNLFNLLNGNGSVNKSGTGEVTFKIQGKELVGVLSNYNSKLSKLK